MDRARRIELLNDMAQERERMYRKMDMLRGRARGPSLADVEDFRNVATDVMDSFTALDVVVTAHEYTCESEAVVFVSPVWEPCTVSKRPADDPVSAWDCRMNGDLWTLEHVNGMWRLWGPVSANRTSVRDLTRVDVSARHLAHDQIKNFYETGTR